MSEYRLRRRTRLKQKQADALKQELSESMGGVKLWSDGAPVETAEAPEFPVILVDNEVVGLRYEGRPFLSVKGLLRYKPKAAWVTVDMGAVRFVTNGADTMAPGITDADPVLREGDLCWIRDERNQQPLAVGQCLMDGPEMASADKGKAVKALHYLGDKLWNWEH